MARDNDSDAGFDYSYGAAGALDPNSQAGRLKRIQDIAKATGQDAAAMIASGWFVDPDSAVSAQRRRQDNDAYGGGGYGGGGNGFGLSLQDDGTIPVPELRKLYDDLYSDWFPKTYGIDFDQWLKTNRVFTPNAAGTGATFDPKASSPYSYDKMSFMDKWGPTIMMALAGAGVLAAGAGIGASAAGVGAEAGAGAVGGIDALVGGGAVDFASASGAATGIGAGITPATVAQSGLLYSGASVPAVAGLTGESLAAVLGTGAAGASNVIGGPLGNIVLDSAGNVLNTFDLANSGQMLSAADAAKAGINAPSKLPTTPPGASNILDAGKQAMEKTFGKTLSDKLIGAGINLIGGQLVNAIAGSGDNGTTSTGPLTDAQKQLLAAFGKLPTEDEAAAQAHGDVTQAFNLQRQNFLRNLRSYGINPGSGRYDGTMRKFQTQEAKTDALGQNLARRGVRSAALGEAATLANITAGLTNTQAVLDSNNFARQQAALNQVRQGLAPFMSDIGPALSKKVSSWFDTASNGSTGDESPYDFSTIVD